MPTAVHDIGDNIAMRGTFKDEQGNLVNPTAIDLTILEAGGTIVQKTIADMANESTGVFRYDYLAPAGAVGRNVVRWAGTATIIEASIADFYVRRPEGTL